MHSLIKCRATIIALRSLYEQDLYFLGTKAMGLALLESDLGNKTTHEICMTNT